MVSVPIGYGYGPYRIEMHRFARQATTHESTKKEREVKENRTMSIRISRELSDEQAVAVGVAAVRDAAVAAGWSSVPADEGAVDVAIDVCLREGAVAAPMVPATTPTVAEQGYTIRTAGRPPVTRVEAGGILGAAYGLCRLADRMRTTEAWPPADEDRTPAFEQRFGFIHVGFASKAEAPYVDVDATRAIFEGCIRQLDTAVAIGATNVLHYDTQDLVPWDHPVLGPRSAACRELYRELIEAAHARNLRIHPMGDEMLYLPSELEKIGATLSTDDPKLWEMLKDKYRGLLRDVPELDGIATRIGEVIPKGDIMAWDVIHTSDDRSLEGNYRRFVKAMHDVVVGEFGKQLFHRTWSVSTWEQSSVPEIYERTFTDEIPTENLILCIKTTVGDQWQWQPLNPTFGMTKHDTAATVETGRAQDYFSGPPDFAVEFAQAGLEWALEHGAVAATAGIRDHWQDDLFAGMEYATWQLMWEPYEPVRDIVAGWARAMIGGAAADRVADLLLELSDVYREGFHIRGVSYNTWEPLRHVRTGYVCLGNPFLDGGAGQRRFLRDQYLMARPELESAIRSIDEYTTRYDGLLESYRGWVEELPDPTSGEWLERILARGKYALHINRAYVTAFLRYFEYEDSSDGARRTQAVDAIAALTDELALYRERSASYGSSYMDAANVQGIVEFLEFAEKGIDDPEAVKRAMAGAPDESGVKRILDERLASDAELIDSAPDPYLFCTWRGRVDGRDVLRLSVEDGSVVQEHYLGDPAGCEELVANAAPTGNGRYAVRMNLGDHRGRVHILDAPTPANGMVLSILLDDHRPGYGSYEFEIYWIAE